MLLQTIVYENKKDYVINELNNIKKYFEEKNVVIGISEAINKGIHFIKIFCDDLEPNPKVSDKFRLYMATLLYKVLVEEFCRDEIQNLLNENYSFLGYEDMREVARKIITVLKDEEHVLDKDMIYCINKKNEIIQKIQECIKENDEINIDGFITFRSKNFTKDLENIINKIVEQYMVDKEYDEFIKLLKYFVDVQESKIDEINIIIKKDGKYEIKDKEDKDIMGEILEELLDSKYDGTVNTEDLIISGLITYCPKEIIIHHSENCINKEFLNTIKKTFESRVKFCSGCNKCNKIKSTLKV